MSQRCKTCSHPRVEEINNFLARGVAYTRIASEFNLNGKGIERHAKHHLQPIIDKANQLAENKIVTKILAYRAEVNYAPLEKVKFLQDKLLTELESAAETSERVSIIKELRGWVQEEAKLSGLYQQERENEQKLTRTIKAIKEYLADFPNADREKVIQVFAKGRNVSVEEIYQQMESIN